MRVDVMVVGGGFYGCALALHLRRSFERVVIVEREAGLLQRASYNNQARLHNGYHYPRSFRTAARSRVHLPTFMSHFRDCIDRSFEKIYCIARRNSRVTPHHFERFCNIIGAPLTPAPPRLRRLFSSSTVAGVYLTEEYAFDADGLRITLERQLEDAGVRFLLGKRVLACETRDDGTVGATLDEGTSITCDWVYNCTYSGLNHIAGIRVPERFRLKHEIAELCLVEPPEAIAELGITVMDGPFWSCMPFPARGLHTLSHVRYTPHVHWADDRSRAAEPYHRLAAYSKETRFHYMVKDAARYMPAMRSARFVESLFEAKTVFVGSELDDSRPILFGRDPANPRIVSILGGKVDNIFDIFEFLDAQVGLPDSTDAVAS